MENGISWHSTVRDQRWPMTNQTNIGTGRKGGTGAGIAESIVCWARCPAWCSTASLSLLEASRCRGFFALFFFFLFCLFFVLFLFFAFPSFFLWGSPLWVRFLRMWPFFNPTIKVVTFRLRVWCVLGVFLLPAFTRLGHERQDLLSPCDEMHVCTD